MARLILLVFLFISCATTKGPSLKFDGYPSFIKGVPSPLMITIISNNTINKADESEFKQSFRKKIVNDIEWISHKDQLNPGGVLIEFNFIKHKSEYNRPYWSAKTVVRVTIRDHREKKKIKTSFKVFNGKSKVFGLSDHSYQKNSLKKSWSAISQDIINFINIK